MQNSWYKNSLEKKAEWNTDWLDNPQNINPNDPDFVVDLSQPSRAIPASKRRAINGALQKMGNYFDSIPFTDIQEACMSAGVVIIQEDGTPWSGFIGPTGRCGETNDHMTFQLAHEQDGQYISSANMLIMTACEHDGRKARTVEVVCYVS